MNITAPLHHTFFALFVSALLLLSGCASSPKSPSQSDTAKQQTNEELVVSPKPSHTEKPAQAPVIARDMDRQPEELEAVTYLLDQAQLALKGLNAERASALSMRALQIERKSPRAYLILAQSYLVQKKSDLSKATAKQGLLYAPRQSLLGQKLRELAN